MTFSVVIVKPRKVTVQVRAESADGGPNIGDAIFDIAPGETFGGYSFQELSDGGIGAYEFR